MKKLINSVDTILTESLDGFAAARVVYGARWRQADIHVGR